MPDVDPARTARWLRLMRLKWDARERIINEIFHNLFEEYKKKMGEHHAK